MAKQCHWDVHGQLKVLSVDDDSVNLMVVEQLLKPEGYLVVSASDGDEALDILESDETWPDFIFLDYQMNTGDSGDKICLRMRQLLGGVPVPIVMCTAMTEGSSVLQLCREAGATDHLLKPYESQRMLAKIRDYCPGKVQTRGAKLPAVAQPAPAAPAPAPAAQAAQPTVPTTAAAGDDIAAFCTRLDLEYCGQKLQAAGVTLSQLRGMDDMALRKAGIVVKAQRDKLLSALASL